MGLASFELATLFPVQVILVEAGLYSFFKK